MLDFSPTLDILKAALALDSSDPLRRFRDEFNLPVQQDHSPQFYFAGHSLGVMPKKARDYIDLELNKWSRLGVAGHFSAVYPWMPYHEYVTPPLAAIVGARPHEVVAMNSLTVNWHLMLASFYRPTAKRFKILIENNAFPSDRYAVDSQARFHGYDPREAVVELKPSSDGLTVEPEHVRAQIAALGDSLALVLLGNCNYLSGQQFSTAEVTQAAHACGALVGFNLAHGAGNVELNLHDDDVDFAVWCSYKYLNAGPGGIAGAYVHERFHRDKTLPRLEGWWGHDKASRFQMGPKFEPIASAEAWQLSNPPIFQLATLRASCEIFARATMPALSQKRKQLTGYLEWLLKRHFASALQIVTPAEQRGAMLCVRLRGPPRENVEVKLRERGVVIDFRQPNIFRIAPMPLYNTFADVYQLVGALRETIGS